VSPRHPSRTQDCTESEARRRVADARAQLDLAELATAASNAEEKKAAASCAVLAGIAAVEPGGAEAAKQLERLLGIKDQAQYGFEDTGGQRLAAARRQARALVAFAEGALNR